VPQAVDNAAFVTSDPRDVQGWMGLLRAELAVLEAGDGLDQILRGVSGAVDRLLGEHAGMAEELLSVYEQLGIVFEVTRKLSTVQRESEVIDLFLDSLRRSFAGRVVFALCPGPHGFRVSRGGGFSSTGWIESLAERVQHRGTVLVESVDVDTSMGRIVEVMVGPVFAGHKAVLAIVLARGPDVAAFHVSDMLLLESLTTFCGDLIRSHRLVEELREMSITVVRSLVNAVDQKDAYTSGHSQRVGYYATLLGRRLRQSDAELQMLQWSALLHDVGKIGIRDEVLKKEGKLTPEEFEHIKEHPVRSHSVVREVPQLAEALDGVLYHHERYDGKGYPDGLAGQEIPLQARIIQIADIFDALTSDRSYRPAFDWRRALAILDSEAGKSVDPELRRVFDEMMRELLDEDEEAWKRLVRHADTCAPVPGEPGTEAGDTVR